MTLSDARATILAQTLGPIRTVLAKGPDAITPFLRTGLEQLHDEYIELLSEDNRCLTCGDEQHPNGEDC